MKIQSQVVFLNVTRNHFILLDIDLDTKLTYILDRRAVTHERFNSNCQTTSFKCEISFLAIRVISEMDFTGTV